MVEKQHFKYIGVLTFSPVQTFLGGGQRLRDWAVGSWLCHYLTAAIVHRWERELGGKVLMPLTKNCDLMKWLDSLTGYPSQEGFWRASLPNVITGLHSVANWQERGERLIREEWANLVANLETVVVHHQDYRHLINGVGWKTIKGDCDCLWSIYSDSLPLPSDLDRVSNTISSLHGRIEDRKQKRNWEKNWWAGRTSPSDANLSIWHPGMQPIDNPHGKGRWGMPYGELNRWWTKVVTQSKKTGIFSSSDRLNSLELLRILSSLSEIIEGTLNRRWDKIPPSCPWNRFPDRTAVAATWVIDRVDRHYWNAKIEKWQQDFLGDLQASSKWGIPKVDRQDSSANYAHPRVLERRNVRDYWQSEPQEKQMLEQWERSIPQSWDCTIEWTVGWRGDGDNMGDWISGSQYKQLGLTAETWHLSIDKFARYQPARLQQNNFQLYRELNLQYIFTLLVLFQCWNELLVAMTEKQHHGRVIFSGGDDFLLLGSLADAVPLTSSLYKLWRGEPTAITSPTEDSGWVRFIDKSQNYPVPGKSMNFSLGVVIAQRRIPQSLWHRGLERACKEAKQADKNRVCLNVLFNSNQSLMWICPWSLWTLMMEDMQPDTGQHTELNRWEKLLSYLARMPLASSSNETHNTIELEEILNVLFKSIGITVTWTEIERAAGFEAREIFNWRWWQDWASIRAFLARQKLKQEQWLKNVATQEVTS